MSNTIPRDFVRSHDKTFYRILKRGPLLSLGYVLEIISL